MTKTFKERIGSAVFDCGISGSRLRSDWTIPRLFVTVHLLSPPCISSHPPLTLIRQLKMYKDLLSRVVRDVRKETQGTNREVDSARGFDPALL
jgi:hypothetical protein